MARTDPNDYISIFVWEVALNDKSQSLCGEEAAAANEDAPAKADRHPIQDHRNENNDVISREEKSSVKEIGVNEMARIGEEALEDVLCKILRNQQSGVRSVVYNFVEQVMLDLLGIDVFGKT